MAACVQTNCPNRYGSDVPTLDCGHKIELCSQHISEVIVQSRIAKGDTYMQCPTCGRRIINRTLEDWIDKKDDEYIDTCLIEVAGNNPSFSICPRVNCPGAQYHYGGTKAPITECRVCRMQYCFTHRVSWEEGENHDCETYGTYAGATMGSNVKPCPSCKIHMTRVSGCNHMKCKNCSYDFCWHCLRLWDMEGYHKRNWYSCPFGEVNSV